MRELARQTGSMDPFSVDFDPRWAKRLAEGSLARQRYLDHVTEQALDVLRPRGGRRSVHHAARPGGPGRRLTDRQREAIHGIHYGGMSMTARNVNGFRAAFPNAVHLSGYGNTLFGVVMEVADRSRTALDYFPLGERLRFTSSAPRRQKWDWPPPPARGGKHRPVLFHRLDESCLLVGVIERDEAEMVAPVAGRASWGQALACAIRGRPPPWSRRCNWVSIERAAEPHPPPPSPLRGGGAGKDKKPLSFSPSPLRGEGWGVGFCLDERKERMKQTCNADHRRHAGQRRRLLLLRPGDRPAETARLPPRISTAPP